MSATPEAFEPTSEYAQLMGGTSEIAIISANAAVDPDLGFDATQVINGASCNIGCVGGLNREAVAFALGDAMAANDRVAETPAVEAVEPSFVQMVEASREVAQGFGIV